MKEYSHKNKENRDLNLKDTCYKKSKTSCLSNIEAGRVLENNVFLIFIL